METGRKPLAGLLILCGWLWFGGIESKAQLDHDSLVHNELSGFDDLVKIHSYDHERYVADTLYAHIVPQVDIETIQDRASCLELDMPLVINKTVCGFVHFFTVRKRNYTQTMLERKNYYFPIFEYYLKKHEMPDALKYLSIVESGLNFKANSRAGAVGLWQFMPGTGTDFYLAQNRHIDERQNPYLATEAACKFLKYLYRTFGDWELALAAYNCGPGNVMKAMRRSGKRGFWDIYDYLPKETRSYVPQFHAVVYSMHFASEHNIHPDLDSMLVTVPLDTFRIATSFDVYKLETILGLPKKSLHQHNPSLRSGVYPIGCKHPLLVPQHTAPVLAANLNRFIDSASVTEARYFIGPLAPENKKLIYYQARKGEHLQKIAEKNSVSLASLKRWNHVSGGKLKKARRLKIYVDKDIEMPEKEVALVAKNETSALTEKTDETSGYHLVKKGEKLYQIAMRYSIPLADIRRFNHLSTSKINTGQKLWLSPQPELKEVSAVAQGCTDESPASPISPARYTVKKGEGLYQIAKANGLSITQIREWNNLRSDKVVAGQELVIALNSGTLCEETVVGDNVAELEQSKPAETKIARRRTEKSQMVALELPKTYKVQKGDTLYSITRKFTRLSVKELMRLNNLKNKNIKPGQQLIVG